MNWNRSLFGSMRTGHESWYEHHAPLIRLYADGLTYERIAQVLGRTPDGVRSSVRKLRDYGMLPVRERIEWPIGR